MAVLQELGESFKDLVYYFNKSNKDIGSVSFKNFIKENKSAFGIKYSELGYKEDGKIVNIPLYLVGRTRNLIKS